MQRDEREAALERTRELLIELLLEVKSAVIKAGANPIKHIEQIQTRMVAAARQSAGVEEWYTGLARKLQLGAPSSSASSTLDALVEHVRATVGRGAFLDLVEREHGYLIASMRVAHEQARDERDARRKALSVRGIADAMKEAGEVQITEEFEELFTIEGEKP